MTTICGWIDDQGTTIAADSHAVPPQESCRCISYNRPDLGGDEPPVALTPRGGCRVDVDACVSDQIQALWNAGIQTVGCCCGHNGQLPGPTVILEHPEDTPKACAILAHDPRDWMVSVWALGDAE